MVIMMPYVQRYCKTFLRYLEKDHVELKGYALFSCRESLDMSNDELHISILSTSFLQREPARRSSFKK